MITSQEDHHVHHDNHHQIACPLLDDCVDHNQFNTKIFQAKGDCGFFHATANCLALLIGLGVLSSPYAVAQGGWMSVVLNFTVALAYFYVTLLLVWCLEANPQLTDYQDISMKALGRRGYRIVIAIFFLDLLSALVSYGISLTDNLMAVIPNSSEIGIMKLKGRYFLTFIATLVILPTVWIRNLRSLSWVSASSVISSMMVLIALVLAATVDNVGVNNTIPWVRLDGLPVASGMYLFCYGANIIVPSIRNSMIDETKFPQVLSLSFLLTALFYGGVGILGACMFGSDTESQITLNLSSGIMPSKVAVWANIITSIMKYSILLRPVAVEVDSVLPWHPSSIAHVIVSIAVRSALVIFLILIALIFPYFADVVSLVGSSITVSLCMILPCCLYWKMFPNSIKKWEKSILLVIIVAAASAGLIGTLNSIISIYKGG